MGRIAPAIACFLIALDCFSRGVGHEPQSLFSPQYLWMWQLFALTWVVTGFRTLLSGTE